MGQLVSCSAEVQTHRASFAMSKIHNIKNKIRYMGDDMHSQTKEILFPYRGIFCKCKWWEPDHSHDQHWQVCCFFQHDCDSPWHRVSDWGAPYRSAPSHLAHFLLPLETNCERAFVLQLEAMPVHAHAHACTCMQDVCTCISLPEACMLIDGGKS